MYGVAGERRPIFLESDAFSYDLDDPTLSHFTITVIISHVMLLLMVEYYIRSNAVIIHL
jgi:hypothetical protein